MLTAIVIPADLGQPIRQQQIHSSNLDAYRQIIGGNLEVVNLDRPSASMYCNEEGKLKGLRVNHRATTLLWVHNSAFRGRDVIAGPALLVGPPNRHGNDTSVPDDLADLLLRTKRYRVQVQTEDDTGWNATEEVFTDWMEAYRHALLVAGMRSGVEEVRVVPELDNELRKAWFQIGRDNPWIKEAQDPPFRIDSFVGCYTVEELEERLSHTNWSLGTVFFYRDLCFINQINGGDEWLTIRHGIAFESITFEGIIERGEFASLITRLLTASREQCERLEY
jgi:hypothetical protein